MVSRGARLDESGHRFSSGALFGALVDLVLPVVCGGCRSPGSPWCDRCAQHLADDPRRVLPRTPAPVGVWACGPYRGPLRSAIIAAKEHGRRDLVEPLGGALARSLITLARWGELPDADRLLLIPAPTRLAAARRRGGDPVEAYCRAAAQHLGPGVGVTRLLRTSGWVHDSAGLSAGARVENLRGAIRVRTDHPLPPASSARPAIVLVDDVVTTGVTVAESVGALHESGVPVSAVVVLAAAD